MRNLRINSLPSKDKRWVDRDEIMLHACFQILQDYIELEKGDTHCNYETHKEYVDEIRFLYKWWLKRKDSIILDDLTDEDDFMLGRLIKIRTFLWT